MAPLSLFSISPDQPFVDVLAHALLAEAGDDPLALARTRILLPSRRAIRSLREAFLRQAGGRPLLLPQMQPVGDVDEEEMLLAGFGAELPPVMSASRRVLRLAVLVHRYHQLEYGPSARMDQAVQLARELATLLDEVAREELEIGRIRDIVPENLAAHWQLTLDFLHIIITQWPAILAEEGKIDPITRRNLLLHALAEQWQAQPPAYPVIAAGTTGSSPATARLLRVVAGLPQGRVVLPAWDASMSEEVWEALDETHPQFGMKQLLQGMGAGPADVRSFTASAPVAPRVALLQEALRPALSTDGWRQVTLDWQAALAGCTRIDCSTTQEEATAIALLLRDTLQVSGKTAALVTPNRDLARRVAAVLRRFHVEIDDSAGIPLSDTPAGVLLHLLSDVAMNRAAPVPLLSLLKHPLARAGLPVGRCRQLARRLERHILRGVRLAEGFDAMAAEIKSSHLSDKEKEECLKFIEQIASIMAGFMSLLQQKEVPFPVLLRAHITAAEALSTDDATGIGGLWQGDEGEQLSGFLHEVLASAQDMQPIDPASYPGILGALLAGQAWRPHYGLHPRVHILSPMEARLQLFDRVVLGGLNEGVWPMDVGQDPWMSRPMRGRFGLSQPERQTGLSAHDFLGLACAKEVFLTRAEKEGGAPSVPSRWLLRLEALLGVLGGAVAQEAWLAGGRPWQRWAAQLDAVAEVKPCAAPSPAPPLEARPRELYVTKIETLLRNPYGIYASKILAFKKLDPLDQEPGAAQFGTIVHDAIERYVKRGGQSLEALVACGREAFAGLLGRPGVEAFWWPRFLRIAAWIAEEEARRAPALQAVAAEQEGILEWQAPAGVFRLRARIDRVETLKDGALRLIDYKTGAPPTPRELEQGVAAQMLLEAVIAQQGTIGQAARRGVAVVDLEYWHLKGGREAAKVLSVQEVAAKKGQTLEAWVQGTCSGVQSLVASYDDPSTPYLHSPVAADKPRFDDFEHLSRVREWGVEG
jgi:ATP-dependent helicase/nuclease subunit B